jgi:ankyrin repeat protein
MMAGTVHNSMKDSKDQERFEALLKDQNASDPKPEFDLDAWPDPLLACAIWTDNADVVRELLLGGRVPTAILRRGGGESGINALHYAALYGKVNALEALLEDQRVIDSLEISATFGPVNGTALLLAISAADQTPYRSSPAAALLLLESGANPNATDDDGCNVMHWCARFPDKAHFRVLQRAIDLGADFNAECEHLDGKMDGDSEVYDRGNPLHISIQTGFEEAALYLLERGAALSSVAWGNTIQTPLMMAPCGGSFKLFELLVSRGGDINEADEDGWTVLHWCCFEGDFDRTSEVQAMVRRVVELGADVRQATEGGDQPIHLAAEYGRGFLIPLLLDLGADVNARCGEGKTPLILAAQNLWNGPSEALTALLAVHADVHAHDDKGRTALSIACANKEIKSIVDLVAAGDRTWDLVPAPNSPKTLPRQPPAVGFLRRPIGPAPTHNAHSFSGVRKDPCLFPL